MMFKKFDLDKVIVNDKNFSPRRRLVKSYVSEFPTDRLLYNFRINAGLPSDAEPLGGWESPEVGLRGHFVGHYLSTLAKYSFSDHDPSLKNKADIIIEELSKCAKPTGYLSAFPETDLDVLETEENRGVWAPYYTLHKVIQGLVDCHHYLGNKKALELAKNLALYIKARFDKLSYWKIDNILRCTKTNPVNEFGGIGDALYALYESTEDENILSLAKVFDRDYFIGNLVKGKDVLENLHANTHLPLILGALHRYKITGEEEFKRSALNFYEYLKGRTFASGNNSGKAPAFVKGQVSENSEHWGPFGDLTDMLRGGEGESCCAHNTERMEEELFYITQDIRILGDIERIKYNAVLNSVSRETGLSQYHQPLGVGCKKKFGSMFDTFWCCTASGIEAMSEVQRNIWYKSEDSILLNMLIESSVDWDEKDVQLILKTDYPNELKAILEIKTNKPKSFQLCLKEGEVSGVKINSKNIDFAPKEGLIIIENTFNDGDIVEMDIQSELHTEYLLGSKDKFAILYGEVLLAQIGAKRYLGEIKDENIHQRMKRVDCKELKFCITYKDELIEFIPLYRIENEMYSVYLNSTENKDFAGTYYEAKDGSSAYES